MLARSEYYRHITTRNPLGGPLDKVFLFKTEAAFYDKAGGGDGPCNGNSIVPIAPYISDVKFSNSIYIAKDLNTITLETTFMYNKNSHKAGIFPSTKMAVGDKLTVIGSGATDENKVFTVTSFERNTAGVEFAKVWPTPSTASDMAKLRIEGNNGTHFTRSHGSLKVFRQEVVEIVLSAPGGADATALDTGYWRIGVNGEQTELLNPQATKVDVAAAISKLNGVTGLVTVAAPVQSSTTPGTNDHVYSVTFTEMEGDVGHVTATAEPGNELSDGGVAASLYVEKVSDAHVLYDPNTEDEEADLLADDVAPGTVINITSSEVVEFIVRGTDGDVADAKYTFTYMGVEAEACTQGNNDCTTALKKLPGLQTVTAPVAGSAGADTTATVGDELYVVTVTLPKGVDGSKLTCRVTFQDSNPTDITSSLYLYTHRHRNNNGRSFTVLKARENRIAALSDTNSLTATHSKTDLNMDLVIGHDSDVYVTGGIVAANTVALHNTPFIRVTPAQGAIKHTVGTTTSQETNVGEAKVQRGQVYTLSGGATTKFAGVLDMELGDNGNKIVPTYCLQNCLLYTDGASITPSATANKLQVLSQDVIVFDGGETRTNTVFGSSDTFHTIPSGASAANSGDIAAAGKMAQYASAGATNSDAYSNAYIGMGGDELYLDSVPDALYSSSAIAMDIEYTGPSGSCSVSEVTKGSKESAVCSNRGVCDYETGTCVCAEGFTKEACSEQSVLV